MVCSPGAPMASSTERHHFVHSGETFPNDKREKLTLSTFSMTSLLVKHQQIEQVLGFGKTPQLVF
eukprot:6483265-Amphidinium_carterae.1